MPFNTTTNSLIDRLLIARLVEMCKSTRDYFGIFIFPPVGKIMKKQLTSVHKLAPKFIQSSLCFSYKSTSKSTSTGKQESSDGVEIYLSFRER
jgi:hypothetical protein